MFSSFSLASISISFDSKLLLNAIERFAGLLEGSGCRWAGNYFFLFITAFHRIAFKQRSRAMTPRQCWIQDYFQIQYSSSLAFEMGSLVVFFSVTVLSSKSFRLCIDRSSH